MALATNAGAVEALTAALSISICKLHTPISRKHALTVNESHSQPLYGLM